MTRSHRPILRAGMAVGLMAGFASAASAQEPPVRIDFTQKIDDADRYRLPGYASPRAMDRPLHERAVCDQFGARGRDKAVDRFTRMRGMDDCTYKTPKEGFRAKFGGGGFRVRYTITW